MLLGRKIASYHNESSWAISEPLLRAFERDRRRNRSKCPAPRVGRHQSAIHLEPLTQILRLNDVLTESIAERYPLWCRYWCRLVFDFCSLRCVVLRGTFITKAAYTLSFRCEVLRVRGVSRCSKWVPRPLLPMPSCAIRLFALSMPPSIPATIPESRTEYDVPEAIHGETSVLNHMTALFGPDTTRHLVRFIAFYGNRCGGGGSCGGCRDYQVATMDYEHLLVACSQRVTLFT